MTLITHADGSVHFSDLKQMSRSAAHYKHHCTTQREPTRALLIGSAVNARVLGQSPRRPILVWRDTPTRAGNAYKAYAASHPEADILTAAEWDESSPIAEAVLADPVARTFLGLDTHGGVADDVEVGTVRYEVPLQWTDQGVPCATTGIDIVGPGYLADLKVVHNAEPEYLQKHALRMMWHAQLVWYAWGWRHQGPIRIDLNGIPDPALHLLCVESSPPHCVTVLTLSPEIIVDAEKKLHAWMERLRQCAEADVWPGYVQAPVTWELPEWMTELEFEDE
jgi:hypothetical protein